AGGGGRERGPGAARVVLGFRAEELGAASGAAVSAVVERVVVLAGERPLRALLSQHVVLLGRQLGAPLRVSLLNLRHHTPSIEFPYKCGNRRKDHATDA